MERPHAGADGPASPRGNGEKTVPPEPSLALVDAVFLGGRLRLSQQRDFPRATADALWLGAFAVRTGYTEEQVVDLGAGTGAVALTHWCLGSARHTLLVDRDATQLEVATINLREHGITGNTLCWDVQTPPPASLPPRASLVVCNPPYHAPQASRPSPSAARNATRQGEVQPFLRAARDLMRRGSRACFAYPAAALESLLRQAAIHDLAAKRLRFLHPEATSVARLVLVEFRRGRAGSTTVEKPAVEWSNAKVMSPEAATLFL